MIDGKGNNLILDSTLTMSVGTNASLLFRDVTIKGLSGSNIIALDNTGTFSFENVELILTGDFSFPRGRIDILKDLTISGNGFSFVYQSPQTSTIRGGKLSTDACAPIYNGALILDQGVTFSYDVAASSTLILMESSISKIVLQSATIVATSNLSLTTGRLMVEGKSSLASGTSIIFGDGLSSANNLKIEIMPAAHLDVLSGKLIYRNI